MKKPITFISIVSILLFLIALGWFAVGIYLDSASGVEQAQAKFDTFAMKTRNAAAQYKCGTPEFSNQFLKAIDNIEDYSSIKLEVNGKLLYSYPPAVFSLPTTDLIKTYAKETTLEDGTAIALTASLYLLKTSSIYNHSRLAFILILAGTLIAFILLALLREKSSDSDDDIEMPFAYSDDEETGFTDDEEMFVEDEPAKKEPSAESTFSFVPEIEKETTIRYEDQKSAHLEQKPAYSSDGYDFKDEIEAQTSDPEYTETAYDSNFAEESDDTEVEQVSQSQENNADETIAEEPVKQEPEISEKQHPLFDFNAPIENISPITGLKLQSSLTTEINTSIKSALSGNYDFTLALLKINGLDRGNSFSNKIVTTLKDKVYSKTNDDGCIFEYNSDSYAVLMNKVDLNDCVDVFDALYQEITEFLKSNNAANEVAIGISSINGRNVDAERILKEADMALEHAIEDPDSPIIAFKANPEKYKEFIENN